MIVSLLRKLNLKPLALTKHNQFLVYGLLFGQHSSGPINASLRPNPRLKFQVIGNMRLPEGLLHVEPADVDADGVDEFIIADENGRVDLISASGKQQWSYTAAGPILTVSPINVDGPDHPQLEVVVGVSDQMILLSSAGQEIWKTRIGPNITSSPSIPGGAQETAGSWLDEDPFHTGYHHTLRPQCRWAK